MKKKYRGTVNDYEGKFERVMARLGVEKYQSDCSQGKGGASCFVEMMYDGKTYRFENDSKKSSACGRNLYYASNLLAEIVYSLEELARAVKEGIFTMDMLTEGVPALQPAAPPLEPRFVAMDFSEMPADKYPGGEAGPVICSVANCMFCLRPTFHGDGINCWYKVIDPWDSTRKCVRAYWTRPGSEERNE